jgi:ADP-dependent NAD(P)H-hydrate dehydratase / NAD(P)H-hydrate epimerase
VEIILSADQMREAEGRCFASGTASRDLMERAGKAVADLVRQRFPVGPVVILCGPGNNGGDGYVVARHLQKAGFAVRLVAMVPVKAMHGDAAVMAARWQGDIDLLDSLEPSDLCTTPLWIDAAFGIGLKKMLPESVRRLARARALSPLPAKIVAVDVPSGLVADRADIAFAVWPADMTVTFAAKKPCHIFQPARQMCGDVCVADIGISHFAEAGIYVQRAQDVPGILTALLHPQHTHKYDRGHLFVASGNRLQTGAARLAARAALRSGAGVVTMLASADAADMLAHHLTAIMIDRVSNPADFADRLLSRPKSGLVIGPAYGVGQECVQVVQSALQTQRPIVLDADALTSFADNPDALFHLCHPEVVLTPHWGEFAKLFPDLTSAENPAVAARLAAARSGAVVVLKGAQTVVAAPDGQVRINDHASPWLATAGSGDVLAGIIGGLMVQGVSTFDAAGAGVWLHGACGIKCGIGLVAEDLPEAIPAVLQKLISPEPGS